MLCSFEEETYSNDCVSKCTHPVYFNSYKDDEDPDPRQKLVISELCLNGSDARTTVLLKNVPRDYTRSDVVDVIKQELGMSRINALHLPEDDTSNFGYCLVNVTDPRYVAHVGEIFTKRRWAVHSGSAIPVRDEVTYAKSSLQGTENLACEFGDRVLCSFAQETN